MKQALRPKQTDTGQAVPSCPAGADVGNGGAKMVLANGERVRIQSQVLENHEELLDIPTSKEGSYFIYKKGSRSDLVNRSFFTGDIAYSKSPRNHIKVMNDPESKVTYALHLVLGILGTLPHRTHWRIFLVLSIHDSQVFRDELTQAVAGTHEITFNANENPPSTSLRVNSLVEIEVTSVLPEGAGAYSWCRREGYIKAGQQAIALDFGTGTTIVNVIGADGSLLYREVLVGGCGELFSAISRDISMRQFRRGQVGDIEIIRCAIEDGSFTYGTTRWDFSEIYTRHLRTWLRDRLQIALPKVADWKDTTQSFIVWGGGAQLPGAASVFGKYGFTAIPEGCWINAIGLQRIAESRLRKG